MAYVPQLLTLAAVLLLACISPGPDFVAITSRALSSRRDGVHVAWGVTAGCVVWAALAMFGLGVVLTQLAGLYMAVRLGGAAYLVYLGGKMLWAARRPAPTLEVQAAEPQPRGGGLRRGFLVNMANPKAAVFFGSLFVTVLPAGAPAWVQGGTLLLVGVVAGAWFTALALMFSHGRVRAVYGRLRRPIDAVMGAALVGLGARLAVSR